MDTGSDSDAEKQELYRQIGQIKEEMDFLKKRLAESIEDRRACIDPNHRVLSIARQCAFLGVARASYNYRQLPVPEETLLRTSSAIPGLAFAPEPRLP